MPKANDHISLANKNQRTLDYLIADFKNHSEWIAIVAFYKAVQVAEAMFVCENGKNCHDHGNRLRRLKTGKYQNLYRSYRFLWSASTVARYLEDNDPESNAAFSSFQDYLTPTEVKEKLIGKRLITFEQLAANHLEDMKTELVKARFVNVKPSRSKASSKSTS